MPDPIGMLRHPSPHRIAANEAPADMPAALSLASCDSLETRACDADGGATRLVMLVHWLLLAALPSALADASPRLFHRIVDPASPDVPFVPRALLSVTGSGPAARASLAPAQNLEADLAHFASAVHHTPGALYQVALERDADPSTWPISSVKAVSLPTGGRAAWARPPTHPGCTAPPLPST